MADIQGISSVCRQNSEILTEGKKAMRDGGIFGLQRMNKTLERKYSKIKSKSRHAPSS